MTLKTVDEVMEMVFLFNHPLIVSPHPNAIRAELEKWQAEIDKLRNDEINSGELYLEIQKQLRNTDEKIYDLLNEIGRLNAIIKANAALDFCLQITAQNKELLAENKRLKDEKGE
jgi:hypothetical protein